MRCMDFVTVYQFKVWNYEVGGFFPSLRMATKGAIERIGAEIIDDSATAVPLTKIDSNGFLMPK